MTQNSAPLGDNAVTIEFVGVRRKSTPEPCDKPRGEETHHAHVNRACLYC